MNVADNPLIHPGNPFERRTLESIAQGKPRPVGGPFRVLPGGTFFSEQSSARRSSSLFPPLHVHTSGLVVPGTVLNVMPTIGGTALDSGTPVPLSLTGVGNEYVVVTISGTPDIVDGVFIRPVLASVSVTIAIQNSAPTSGDLVGSDTFKFLLATFVNGAKTGQNGYGPIGGEICDDLTESGTGQMNLSFAGYSL